MKILQCGITEIFLPTFSSRTFMVSHLILNFLSILSLFWYMVYVGGLVSFFLSLSFFFFFACTCPDLPIPFIEEAIFTPFYAPSPFVKY